VPVSTASQSIDSTLGKQPSPALFEVYETYELLNGRLESIEMRCDRRISGPFVWYLHYEFAGPSISTDNMHDMLIAKYGNPTWSGKAIDAGMLVPTLIWSVMSLDIGKINQDASEGNLLEKDQPQLIYQREAEKYVIELNDGKIFRQQLESQYDDYVVREARGQQGGPHF
jgi:hypothetical protein